MDTSQTKALPVRISERVEQADKAVGNLAPAEAAALISDPGTLFIDVRDVRELAKTGRIPGAKHCPRGMLEFWIDPQSPYHKSLFAQDGRFLFYCASGWRSALSAQTAKEMGLQNVTHLKGGITAWLEAGLPVDTDKKENGGAS